MPITIELTRKAFEGIERTIEGITVPPTEVVVRGLDVHQDPLLALLTHPDGYPIGRSFKWESIPVVCYGHRVGEPRGYTAWQMFVLWRALPFTASGWRLSLRGFLNSERVLHTIDNPPEIIGTNKYNPSPQEAATHYINNGPDGIVYLRQTTLVVPYETEVPRPGWSLYFYRDDIQNVSLQLLGAVGSYLGNINSETFFGSFTIPYSVMFSEMAWEQIPGIDPNNPAPQTGLRNAIQLRFDINAMGFDPLRLYHTMTNALGDRELIKTVGSDALVFSEKKRIVPSDLNVPLGLLSP